MALKKEIILSNGVCVEYHRITSLNKTGNVLNIAVLSYVNKYYRDLSLDNYVKTSYYTFENIDLNVSFKSSYDLLKGHEDFQGAEDI